MNTKLRTEAKNDFDFFKLMNNSVFGKIVENIRKCRDIRLVTTDKRRKYLMLEPNYHTTKRFSRNLPAIEMNKAKVKMNRPVYVSLLILKISEKVICKFWYDYLKPKYQENAKLCYMDTDSFIVYIKQKIFMKTLPMMLKKDLTHQIM